MRLTNPVLDKIFADAKIATAINKSITTVIDIPTSEIDDPAGAIDVPSSLPHDLTSAIYHD